MPGVIKIRRAEVNDAPTLCATEVEVSATPGLLVSRPDELSPDSFSRMIVQLAGDVGCYFVAEDEGRIVGHAFLCPMDLRAVAHVYRLTIVVHPTKWKHGVGRALMEALCKWASHSPRVEKIELLVRSTNEAAVSLYAQFCFVEEGRLRNRIRLPSGAFVDDISMAWFPERGHA
ncbi:MAG: GNAT family N-acetyltransferase [Casimicrobiaceae bacterium]